jgi:hypothetical protein
MLHASLEDLVYKVETMDAIRHSSVKASAKRIRLSSMSSDKSSKESSAGGPKSS